MDKWTHPSHYFGEEYPDYYVLIGRTRDSDALARANFEEALERLGGESETVKVIRSNHWLVGWVESIMIHESDKEHVAEGEKIEAELKDYPILNDDRYFTLESEEVYGYWKSASLRERICLCRDVKIPIVAARHDDAPSRYDELYEMLRQ